MADPSVINLEPDEQLVYTVKRTKIGLIPIVVIGLVVFFGMLLAIFLIARFRTRLSATVPINTALVVVIGLALLVGLVLVVMVIVYLGNRMIITNERIVSLVQNSLFQRSVSTLGLESFEDVAVKQNGIFATLFGYGVLEVETAGEMNNFIFKLAAKPYEAAKVITDTVEQFRETHGILTSPPAPPPSP